MSVRRRRERPVKRRNPSGKTVWVARYARPDGVRAIWKPDWNGGKGTFDLQRDAQRAIDEAHDFWGKRPARVDTIGGYFATWTQRHPRSERTNDTNEHRIGRVLDVELEHVPLRDWVISDLRRRHATELVDHLLRVQARSALGAKHIISSLSAMCEDAINDEVAELNPFKGVKVRRSDPRVTKKPRPVRVFDFDAMHAFAGAAAAARTSARADQPSSLDRWRPVYAEALVRVFCDLGVRLGEALPLERRDLDQADGVMRIRRTAHEGVVQDGTKTDHGEDGAGRDVPVPPSLMVLLVALPARIDTPLLFPTPTGRLWRERNFYRDVWYPAQAVAGIDVRPHEMRHSYITHLRAAGVDDADLADIAGHTIETMLGKYTHALRRSHDQVRGIIG